MRTEGLPAASTVASATAFESSEPDDATAFANQSA